MECTQRLECTQDFTSTQSINTTEQIGFLGIQGQEYPIKKGINIIGRDPATCNIVLDINSVSRKHAVINVRGRKHLELMDLNSANRTMLMNKALKPYLPMPLHNGDLVQFGQVLGVFQFLNDNNENDDLPMTQALDIQDSPAPLHKVTRVIAPTTVPESPDVSDKDDSIIQPSPFQTPKSRIFTKSEKTISFGNCKTDKAECQKNKENLMCNNIHELETQMPPGFKDQHDNKESIHTANTQLPENIFSADTQIPDLDVPSIHTMNTQLPPGFGSPSIHNMETQSPTENLPNICKISKQKDMRLDLCVKNKNDIIFDTDTQKHSLNSYNTSLSSVQLNKINKSDDEILFDDIINEPYEEIPESQGILSKDIDFPMNRLVADNPETSKDKLVESEPDFFQSQIAIPKSVKRNMRIGSDCSTDCEDIEIIPTQQSPEKKTDNDTTDCEDIDTMIELKIDKTAVKISIDNMEDFPTQVIEDNIQPPESKSNANFEDLPTQVLLEELDGNEKENHKIGMEANFEDLPTQIIEEDLPSKKLVTCGNNNTKCNQESSIFKIPLKKVKRISKTPKIKPMNYYQSTQEVIEDLNTQKEDHFEVNEKLHNLNKIVSKNLAEQVFETIGGDKAVAPVTKVPTDESTASESGNNSDTDIINRIAVPNSQEMNYYEAQNFEINLNDSVCESETEIHSEECSPIVFKMNQKSKTDVTLNVLKKVDPASLPSRFSARVRKPTEKVLENKKKENILNTNYSYEKEYKEQNVDVLKGNVSVLKIQNALKNTLHVEIDKVDTLKEIKKEKQTRSSRKKTDNTVDVKSENNVVKTETSRHTKGRERQKRDTRSTKKQSDANSKESIHTDLKIYSCDGNDFRVEAKKSHSTRSKKTVKTEDKPIPPNIENTEKNTDTETKIKISRRGPPRESQKEVETKDDIITDKERRNIKTLSVNRSSSSTRSLQDSPSFTSIPTDTNNCIHKKNEKTANKRAHTKNVLAKKPEESLLKAIDKDNENEIKRKPTRRAAKTQDKSPEKEIRRSRRQKPESVKKEPIIKSIFKKSYTLEESAVYNTSSSSDPENRSFKRPTDVECEAPCPKRTKVLSTQYVLFTAYPYAEVKDKLENIGAVVVTDLMKATVVVTKQIKRTFKLLCAVGLGKPIVGDDWLQACIQNNTILDPWRYLIKDEVAEKRFYFNLEKSLKGKRNFLRGYNVSSTPKATPPPEEMKLIVECSGGRWQEGGANWVVVTAPADRDLWPALRDRGATLVTNEFIVGGVLRQRVDVNAYKYK